ncbi:MAG: GNAT family N-acetyltransferase [Flavobacteriaceae bacterium]|nr:GNAT family N-acetyltransferase [Flavobacteriaceae bacterium]
MFQKHGYAANLNHCKSIDEYMAMNFKSSFRNNVKRSVKRLETSFDITYNMFFGKITYEAYNSLMTSFHDLLSKRFQQLKLKNVTLENWTYYFNIAYQRINNKEASLFVMYKDQEPIAFSLNFHFDTVFYFAIPTFNADFSKFTLGNVVIYKNLEWCLNNGVSLFDMGYGGFENKINWCNTTYHFETHIFFKPKNLMGYAYTSILKYKYKLINYLLAKNVNVLIRNMMNMVKGEKSYQQLTYKSTEIDRPLSLEDPQITLIEDYHKIYAFLNKPLYDFLYIHHDSIKHIKIYKFKHEPDTFLITGTKNQSKIKILQDDIH